VAVRVAIVIVAVAAIVLLGSRLRDHDRCDSARAAVGERAGELTASCRDPDVIASASAVLLAAGQPDRAVRLARESVRREPESFVGWVALGLTLRDRDPAGSRAALARAKALNPRWQGLR
jgi:predicted Zn-dependent protease